MSEDVSTDTADPRDAEISRLRARVEEVERERDSALSATEMHVRRRDDAEKGRREAENDARLARQPLPDERRLAHAIGDAISRSIIHSSGSSYSVQHEYAARAALDLVRHEIREAQSRASTAEARVAELLRERDHWAKDAGEDSCADLAKRASTAEARLAEAEGLLARTPHTPDRSAPCACTFDCPGCAAEKFLSAAPPQAGKKED